MTPRRLPGRDGRRNRQGHPRYDAGRLDCDHRGRCDDRGQATVELALLLPLVAVLLLSVVQVALVARDHNLATHAAREAARVAAVDDDPAAARRAAEQSGPLAPDRLRVDVGERGPVGSRVTVVVRYSSPVRIPVVGQAIGNVDLEARATMRVER